MAIKSGILFATLLLGALAVPVPDDVSIFFPENHNSRIVGGSVAAQGAHPWMVAMSTGAIFRSFMCGGSVITQRTVLTAAHCIVPVLVGNTLNTNLRVTVGTNTWSSGGQTLTLSGHSNHASYDSTDIKYDIGVLYTTSEIIYSNIVRPISLSFDHVGGGVAARVAGWGAVRAQGPAQANLLEIEVATLSPQGCIDDMAVASASLNVRAPPIDPAIEICTFHSVNVGACQGDSGSALVRIDNGAQFGVVSWGFPCALGAPDVFVRVSGFQSWILQNTVS